MRMLRYYAIATLIVLTVAVAMTAHAVDFMHFRFRSSNRPQPPQHVAGDDRGGVSDAPLSGDAPWALSALPDCFVQQAEWTGTATYVDVHLPHAAPVAPGTQMRVGPCTISVGRGELFVRRGNDRFRIPPLATLYRTGPSLWLLRRASGSSVLRSYSITQ